MKKFLFKISIFLLLFTLSNLVFLKLIQKFDWNFSKLMYMDAFENQDYECLIIGNSLALDGFDMTQFDEQGIEAYNCAIVGSSIKSNLVQLEQYLSKNKAPKMIIHGMSSYRNTDFNSEIIYPAVDYLYVNTKPSYQELPMIKFKWMGAELLKKIVSSNHRNAEVYKGQLRSKRTVPDKTQLPKNLVSQLDLSRYENAHYLASIDSICLEHNIKQISIEMPAYLECQNAAPIGPIKYINSKGVERSFYNLTNTEFCKIFNPKTDWLGDSHLNLYGSQKFTKYLFDYKIISF